MVSCHYNALATQPRTTSSLISWEREQRGAARGGGGGHFDYLDHFSSLNVHHYDGFLSIRTKHIQGLPGCRPLRKETKGAGVRVGQGWVGGWGVTLISLIANVAFHHYDGFQLLRSFHKYYEVSDLF